MSFFKREAQRNMHFTIQRNLLLEAVQKVQSVVEKRNTIQILGNILCSVKNQELYLCATDLEVGVKVSLPIESSQEGKITLSAKNFSDIVRELPDQPLHVTRKDNNWVEIVSGKSKFNIVSLSADEYPSLPVFEEKTYFDARTEALIDMINRTEFAVSTDTTRYNISGVCFEHLENGVMRMTATDGHRLSFVDHEVFLKMPELKKGIIIPRKGLTELRKLMQEGGSTVGLAFERGYIFVRMNGSYLFIRLIEGEYPDYRMVIPREINRLARVHRESFHSALKRVSLLAHEKSRGVKLSLQNGVMAIHSSNPDMGEAREEIDLQYEGEATDISFNSRFLLEYLSVVTSEQLEFHFKDRLSPGILKGEREKGYTYLIMPMRI